MERLAAHFKLNKVWKVLLKTMRNLFMLSLFINPMKFWKFSAVTLHFLTLNIFTTKLLSISISSNIYVFLPFFKHKRFSPPKFVLTRIDQSWESLTCHKTIVKAAPENHINTLFNGFTLRLRTLERSMAKKQKKLRITIQIHTDTVPLRPHVLTRSTG